MARHVSIRQIGNNHPKRFIHLFIFALISYSPAESAVCWEERIGKFYANVKRVQVHGLEECKRECNAVAMCSFFTYSSKDKVPCSISNHHGLPDESRIEKAAAFNMYIRKECPTTAVNTTTTTSTTTATTTTTRATTTTNEKTRATTTTNEKTRSTTTNEKTPATTTTTPNGANTSNGATSKKNFDAVCWEERIGKLYPFQRGIRVHDLEECKRECIADAMCSFFIFSSKDNLLCSISNHHGPPDESKIENAPAFNMYIRKECPRTNGATSEKNFDDYIASTATKSGFSMIAFVVILLIFQSCGQPQ